MAQVALTPVQVTSSSVVDTLTAANSGSYPSGGNSYPNSASTWLEVNNADAGAHTMTVSWIVDGVTVTRTQSVTNGTKRLFTFPVSIYGTTINIHFDAVTSVTVNPYYI